MIRWSIRAKLATGVVLLATIVGVLSWGGIFGLYSYRALVRSLSRRVFELPLAGEFAHEVSDLRVSYGEWRGAIGLRGDPGPRVSARWGETEFREHLASVQRALEKYVARLEDNSDHAVAIDDSHRERQTAAEIGGVLAAIVAGTDQGLVDAGDESRDALEQDLARLQELAAELPSFLHANIIDFTQQARQRYRTLIVLSWVTSVTTGVVCVALVRLFYRWLFRPLRILIKGSRKVAAGQFQHRIRLESQDEMAELAAAMNDMTSRFQSIRDDLDRQVQERTRQVVRSEQLASVGFLAAGVAHEINNPLASIAMCAESLEGRLEALAGAGDDARQVFSRYLRMIQDEAFRCKDITEKLLDFSRLGESTRQPTALRPLVQGVIDMLRHLGKYQQHEVRLVPGDDPWVLAQAQEIKQVVLNLLTNALDSIEDSGVVTVEIAVRGTSAELAVRDTGCGMTSEVLDHLFEPFFSRRRHGNGTGLGLAISYRIVSEHGGVLEAASEGVNRGSTFRVGLPLAQCHKEESHRSQAA